LRRQSLLYVIFGKLLLYCREVIDGVNMFHIPRSVLLLPLAIVGVTATASHPIAAEKESAQRGREIAEKWCAQCHRVDAGAMRFDKSGPATFQKIADTPGISVMSLKIFFQTPHKKMPNFSMTYEVRDQLISFIVSLKCE